MNKNEVDIRVTAKNLAKQTLQEVKGQVREVYKETRTGSAAVGVLTGVIAGLTTSVTNFGISLVQSGIDKLHTFFQQSVDAATDFAKSMTTLEIIAPRFNVAADKAKEAAAELGKELRIGVGPAAESIQNLLKSGLNLDQSKDLLRRFTNEAITGKASTISLAQAVQNLSFAYTTQNSALGNLSGISENFQDIIDKGREALKKQGVPLRKITDDMAKYRGMIDLTNLTMGSAEKFVGSYTDKQAQLGLQLDEVRLKLGEYLLPVLTKLTEAFSGFVEGVASKGSLIKEEFEGFITKVGEFLSVMGILEVDTVNAFDTGRGAGEKLGDLIGKVIEKVTQLVQYAIDHKDELKDNFERGKAAAQTFLDVIEKISGTLDSIDKNGLVDFGLRFSKLQQSAGIGGIGPGAAINAIRALLGGGMDGGVIKGYQTGGEVRGPKMGSGRDNILVRAEEGEVILNKKQQNSLMKQLDRAGENAVNIINNFYGYNSDEVANEINRQVKLGY